MIGVKEHQRNSKSHNRKVESELDLIYDNGLFCVDIPKEILLEMIKANNAKLKAFVWEKVKKSLEQH